MADDALLAAQVSLAEVLPAEQPDVLVSAIDLALEHIRDTWEPDEAAEVLARLLALTSTEMASGPASFEGANTPALWAKELISRASEMS